MSHIDFAEGTQYCLPINGNIHDLINSYLYVDVVASHSGSTFAINLEILHRSHVAKKVVSIFFSFDEMKLCAQMNPLAFPFFCSYLPAGARSQISILIGILVSIDMCVVNTLSF